MSMKPTHTEEEAEEQDAGWHRRTGALPEVLLRTAIVCVVTVCA